jgi:PGF-CTERM protein
MTGQSNTSRLWTLLVCGLVVVSVFSPVVSATPTDGTTTTHADIDAELGSKDKYFDTINPSIYNVVEKNIDVTNTGNVTHTFYVGFGVTDPNGEAWNNGGTAGTAVTLDPGETQRVAVEWDVESDAPSGMYDGAITVWTGNSSTDLGEPLDTVRFPEWFYLDRSLGEDDSPTNQTDTETPTVAAELGPKDQYYDTINPSIYGMLDKNIDVTNTGDERHTFYVGFGVTDPNGDAYNNGGASGTAVTLDPGETQRVTLTWDVPRDAPSGMYDGAVTVWSGDSSANLGEALDTVRYPEWFYLDRSLGENDSTDQSDDADEQDVTPEPEPAIDAELGAPNAYDDQFETGVGDTVSKTIDVTNTGDETHNHLVALRVTSPTGETFSDFGLRESTTVELGPGETKSVTVTWVVREGLPEGTYDGEVTVYRGATPTTADVALDSVTLTDWFTIERTTPPTSTPPATPEPEPTASTATPEPAPTEAATDAPAAETTATSAPTTAPSTATPTSTPAPAETDAPSTPASEVPDPPAADNNPTEQPSTDSSEQATPTPSDTATPSTTESVTTAPTDESGSDRVVTTATATRTSESSAATAETSAASVATSDPAGPSAPNVTENSYTPVIRSGDDDVQSSGAGPGFGIAVAVAALLVVGLGLRQVE